jgi:dTDP-4-amino-4,6-dideoxygalactose transaminase
MGDLNIAVPYVDLSAQWSECEPGLLPVMLEILRSGVYVNGDPVEAFERRAARYLGVEHCVALNSGTDALVCALLAVGVRSGTEVITTANSFIASTAAICHLGAIPVFVDVLDDQGMDPDKIAPAITGKTSAVMAVCSDAGLPVVEDAAQCIGAKYGDMFGGTVGDVGCFSAHPLKNLNALGDSGFIVARNREHADMISSMRNHGLVDRNTVERFGYVSRMDVLQAAVLSWKIDNQLDSVNERRRSNARFYKDNLTPAIHKPFESKADRAVYHTYVIQTDKRDALKEYLDSNLIGSAIHYPIPIHLQPAYVNKFGAYERFPLTNTERQANQILSLPVHQNLKPDQLARVCGVVNEFIEANQ